MKGLYKGFNEPAGSLRWIHIIRNVEVTSTLRNGPENYHPITGADLEIFDRGGPIDYTMGIYQNSGQLK